MKASRIWLLASAVLAGHAYFAWASWQMLPSRAPTMSRVAADTTLPPAATWFGIVGASAFVFVLIRILCSPTAVAGWNIPEKDRFLKLPAEKQAPVAEIILAFGAMSAICVMLIFWTLHAGMLSMVLEHSTTLPWWTFAAIGALPIGLLLALIPWSRAVTAAIVRAERA